MKKILAILTTAIFLLGLTPTFAQFGRPASGPNIDSAMAKLFGEHSTFSAALEFQTAQPSGDTITMPGKLFFDAGKSRFEMNLSEAQGLNMPPDALAHMKSMGMDSMISISRPDKQAVYLLYPGLNSYVESPTADSVASGTNDYKIETTELGKETVDGHACVKNKVVVTDKDGNKHESTVWNATDLKNFPVKITSGETNHEVTMLFKQISFDKPDAIRFETPASFTKYDNVQTMLQTEMIKKMGGGLGLPPGR